MGGVVASKDEFESARSAHEEEKKMVRTNEKLLNWRVGARKVLVKLTFSVAVKSWRKRKGGKRGAKIWRKNAARAKTRKKTSSELVGK